MLDFEILPPKTVPRNDNELDCGDLRRSGLVRHSVRFVQKAETSDVDFRVLVGRRELKQVKHQILHKIHDRSHQLLPPELLGQRQLRELQGGQDPQRLHQIDCERERHLCEQTIADQKPGVPQTGPGDAGVELFHAGK